MTRRTRCASGARVACRTCVASGTGCTRLTRDSSGTRRTCGSIDTVQVHIIDNAGAKSTVDVCDFIHRHGARRIVVRQDGTFEVVVGIRCIDDEHGVTCDVGQFWLNGKAYCAVDNRG